MLVSDLKTFLSRIADGLSHIQAAQAAKQVDTLAEALDLEPYRSQSLADFSKHLREHSATTKPPRPKPQPKEKAVPVDKATVVAELRDALARIRTPEVTFESLDDLAKKVEKLGKDEAIAAAREFGVEGEAKTRKAATERIRVMLQSAKEAANSGSW